MPTNTVNSYDEWGDLQEVIVGTAYGACVPKPDPVIRACVRQRNVPLLQRYGGGPFPTDIVRNAQYELDGLARALTREGIVVQRPDHLDHTACLHTPDFETQGVYAAMPRDILSTLGNTILEAPMGWRQRHFEHRAYRGLLSRYHQAGAGWLTAPTPKRADTLYRLFSTEDANNAPPCDRYVTTEAEPCFDAADLIRCGRDIFIQRSQVTNQSGIDWIRRNLPTGMRLHQLSFDDPNPMHIDSTLTLLRPGLALINPTRPCHQAELFSRAGWQLLPAPLPTLPEDWPLFLSSPWLSMNILSLSPTRVVVEEQETPLITLLTSLGFSIIPLPFRHVYSMGGSFHCATCDIRRKSTLQNYGFAS